MGVEALLAQDPRGSVGDTFPTFDTDPRLAGEDPAQRRELRAGLVAWRHRYRAALDAWTGGDRKVRFPAGAYWLPYFHGARLESGADPPDAE